MKVFLSWSGSRSHKIAIVFRDWLPSVIQEIVPYVSSEDIDKGTRWSTDIAKELVDSTFGILCVTKDNINAPWLNFEAGALSKTIDKSFVSPFLFDIKRSEVHGPILQFQSTVFDKEDLKKLVTTLNKACNDSGLKDDRLGKAFNVWYPSLEAELNKLRDSKEEPTTDEDGKDLNSTAVHTILEEILDLSRNNQKLIRNPDGSLGANLQEMTNMVKLLIERFDRSDDIMYQPKLRKFYPEIIEEFMHMPHGINNGYIGVMMALGLVRSQMPWVYDAGVETINILRSKRNIQEKLVAIEQFKYILTMSFEHPMMRESFRMSKDLYFSYRRIPDMLMDLLQKDK
jgi:hypothetical protein